MFRPSSVCSLALCLALPCLAPVHLRADGDKDNHPESVRPIPPPGVEVPPADAARLTAGIEALGKEIATLKRDLAKKPNLLALLPDVVIYHKAVQWALTYGEFHRPAEIAAADQLLATGQARARSLRQGEAPWTRQTGPVVRGYRSGIDGSVQPFGLVIPAGYDFDHPRPTRLDFWFHGRGETLSELSFLLGREKATGPIAPEGAIVLHPYGRYSCANKFAGEIDTFEALAKARQDYRIDDDRLLVRGFSMGGAAAWHFAVHYADRWCAAQPGAGFSETPDFLRVYQEETLTPTPWQKTLWHWYDCTDWAANVSNLPLVAYSGEIDKQKQAADVMEAALAKEKIRLVHLIGPGMAHQTDPGSAAEIERRLTAIADRGIDRVPRKVRLVTWTLRYPTLHWVRADALASHWAESRIEAEWNPANWVAVTTTGVTAFSLDFAPGLCPLDSVGSPVVKIDGQTVAVPGVLSDRSWQVSFVKQDRAWTVAGAPAAGERTGLVKRHGLQGPIDDAFMDAFLMVEPTGTPLNATVGAWAKGEQAHAGEHWRKQFRGLAPVKKDTEINEADLASHNLVLWGDPRSNAVLARIADRLPIRWTEQGIVVGDRTFDSGKHALVMIYPNPLNPDHYIVINSGFTYREYDYLNNARQVAKLPDWAVIDLTQPVTTQDPGGVPVAGFFGEHWELK